MRQRKGECLQYARAKATLAGGTAPGLTPHMRAHERESELPGKQFIIGQTRPGRAVRQNIVRVCRSVQCAQCCRKFRKTLSSEPTVIWPFRQLGQAFESAIHRTPDIAEREALG